MAQQKELPWIAEARKYIGLTEIPGKNHNPTILNWLHGLKAWWKDDETPWSGVFAAHCLRVGNRDIPKDWMRAKEYAFCGKRLTNPAYGCLVVFTRQGGGHVGFVVGKDKAGNLLVLGGNQGNRVSIAAFPTSRVAAYVWPSVGGAPLDPAPERYNLPLGGAAMSRSEA